ncbi:hypothetical protein [Paenibacillus sp. MMS20-IR301]|uniref:hypothetical protein n=1 Tax=Paenibacillus sp. MMS20-IR301 TaxID=2895946 RepID=UPI0028E1D885|nr:hypothetical protein [Paenibacillus sp. MMS20-IR301]WNS44088.1 hypothetical protein LOS79_02140 [Paenibacillus sp. MMS20-IR301]
MVQIKVKYKALSHEHNKPGKLTAYLPDELNCLLNCPGEDFESGVITRKVTNKSADVRKPGNWADNELLRAVVSVRVRLVPQVLGETLQKELP